MDKITIEEYRKLTKPAKYGNRKVEHDGYVFDSAAEAARYRELSLLENAGAITDLRVHSRYELQKAFQTAAGVRLSAIHYESDFDYWERGKKIVEDVKGVETAAFKLKRKLFLYQYPQIELRVLKVK